MHRLLILIKRGILRLITELEQSYLDHLGE